MRWTEGTLFEMDSQRNDDALYSEFEKKPVRRESGPKYLLHYFRGG